MDNIKITFVLDGNGIIYDKYNPIHFDGLLEYAIAQKISRGEPVGSQDATKDLALPLCTTIVNGYRIYKASALFPTEQKVEYIQYFRTKYPQEYHEFCSGTANLQKGLTRDHNRPYQVLLTESMVCYCVGSYRRISNALFSYDKRSGEKNFVIKGLGLKRHMGLGGISDIIIEKVDYDWSLVRNGKAMRYLPTAEGTRTCRIRPPYWNLKGMVRCCDVGDDM